MQNNIVRKAVTYIERLCSSLVREYLSNIHLYSLDELVEKYRSIREVLLQLRSFIVNEIEQSNQRIEEILIGEIIKHSNRLPLKEIVRLCIKANIAEKVLSKIPRERILRELPSLENNQVLELLEKRIHFLRDELFEELVRRSRIVSCNEVIEFIERLKRLDLFGLYLGKEVAILAETLFSRPECPQGMIKVFELSSLSTELCKRYPDIALKFLRTAVETLTSRTKDLSCSNILALYYRLSDYFEKCEYHINYYTKQEMLNLIKTLSMKVVESLELCNVSDLQIELLEEWKLYNYVDDKKKYFEALSQVILRDLENLEPGLLANIVKSICSKDVVGCDIIFNKLGLQKLAGIAYTSLERFEKELGKCSDLSIFEALSHILQRFKEPIEVLRPKIESLCDTYKHVYNLLLKKIYSPSNIIEFSECYYWVIKILRTFVSRWCGYEFSLPRLDIEKLVGVIKHDLEMGVDVYGMRDSIRRLYEVDEELAKLLEYKFNKYRLKMGIKLRKTL